MQDTHEPTKRFIAGDPLRGLSALSIAAFHVAFFAPAFVGVGKGGTWYGGTTLHVVSVLGALLYIFFVLSGFLISRPFVRWIIYAGEQPSITQYVRNRALRIAPAFWTACIIAIVLHGVSNSARQLFALFAFGQIFTHGEGGSPTFYVGQGWSISIEVLFYAAVPVVAVVLARILAQRGSPQLRAAVIVALSAVAFGASVWARGRWGTNPWNQRLPEAMLFAFTPGIAFAAVEPFVTPILARIRMSWIFPTILFAAGFVVLWRVNDTQSQRHFAIYCAVGSALIVGSALMRQWSTGDSWRFLDNRAMHWIGERSLSIYILHFLIQRIVFSIADRWGVTPSRTAFFTLVIVCTALTLLAAAVSYRFIERPAMARRKRTLQPPIAEPAPA